jgi:hypothetical protein
MWVALQYAGLLFRDITGLGMYDIGRVVGLAELIGLEDVSWLCIRHGLHS